MSATGFLIPTILQLLSLSSWGFVQDPDHENVSSPPSLSLLLSPNDREDIFQAVFQFWQETGETRFPTILAIEPGPLDLQGGLRLLANEIPPKLTVPELLIISNMGDLAITDLFLVFLRRCLAAGTQIWIVGDFPEELIDFPLEPGHSLRRVSIAQLGQLLRSRARYGPQPDLVLPHQ